VIGEREMAEADDDVINWHAGRSEYSSAWLRAFIAALSEKLLLLSI
jgi:hypothetical protein